LLSLELQAHSAAVKPNSTFRRKKTSERDEAAALLSFDQGDMPCRTNAGVLRFAAG
jgi:hypothetical protein